MHTVICREPEMPVRVTAFKENISVQEETGSDLGGKATGGGSWHEESRAGTSMEKQSTSRHHMLT